MEGVYGVGKYCIDDVDLVSCCQLGDLEQVLVCSCDYILQLDVWQGWYSIIKLMCVDYQCFVGLVNEGVKEMGFVDVGQMWCSGYDMLLEQIGLEIDWLWEQVKLMYEQLYCYVCIKLDMIYGKDKVEVDGGLIVVYLFGNMWQQDWFNLWDQLEFYLGVGSLDIIVVLEKQYQINLSGVLVKVGGNGVSVEVQFKVQCEVELWIVKQMIECVQDFYVLLGMLVLLKLYWDKIQFIKLLDCDVVCYVSVWDMNMDGDVCIKMCIKLNEEIFIMIYYELGYIYYDLVYNLLLLLFQGGVNDGFYEVIGDIIVLVMILQYFNLIGLVDKLQESCEVIINVQMCMVLSGVLFLLFGLMIDCWCWGVFDGLIILDYYNQVWWDLKVKYQGVVLVSVCGEEFFDLGVKYYVLGNMLYICYFLVCILQFQFYKGLCDVVGYMGLLYQCSFYGNKEVGQKFWVMLSKGVSQLWQVMLKEIIGGDKFDVGLMIEYFSLVNEWFKQQNQGQMCGWQVFVVIVVVKLVVVVFVVY